jgi:thiol-disulfide isomerase/thioredoxin
LDIRRFTHIRTCRMTGKGDQIMRPMSLLFTLLIVTGIVYAGDLTGKKAPAFTAKDTKDNKISLSDYQGKVVLLDFWASWCVPCREEFPFLIRFYEAHQRDDFIILAVNIDNKEENMQSFLSKFDIPPMFPVIYDSEKAIPPLYELESMPTSIFIDKKGIIRYTHTGFNDSRKKEFKEELSTLLKEK